MKLLVISMLYEPDFVGIAAVASDMCKELADRGHDVTVYTAYPYYPEWERKSNSNPWRIQQEKIGRVTVRRHGLFIPSRPSKLLPRIAHELSFPLSLSRSLFHRGRFDVVMVFCPLLGSVAFAALRKVFYREPLWINIQDLPAEAGRATGINGSRLFHYLGKSAQQALFARGEVWSSISPEMVAQLDRIKPPKTSLHFCPNWLIGSLADRVAQLPCKVGKPPHRPLELLYSGTIGKKQALVQFCKALSACQIDFRFQICGDGSEADSIRDWARDSRDPRFHVSGLLPESEFVQRMHDADMFVITEMQGAGASFLPSKLIPCISIGTPVLAIADRKGPLGSEIAQHEIGLGLEWSELSGLPRQLEELSLAHERFFTFQENCLQRARSYQRDVAIDNIEELLSACAQASPVVRSSRQQSDGIQKVQIPQ